VATIAARPGADLGPPARLPPRAPWLRSAVIVGVPAVALAVASVVRALHGLGSVDLAILDQSLWAASRGHRLYSSILRENLLGDHFEPGMLLFVPLYRLVATRMWLLLGQTGAAVAAVLLITGRLRHTLSSVRRAVLGAVVLASTPVAYALIFDVHALVFAGPFAIGSVFAAQDGRPRRAAILGLLAAMFRVEAGVGVLVALLLVRRRRDRSTTLALAVVGAYLPLAYLLEARLGAGDSHWTGHFEHLGHSPADALAHPARVVTALLSTVTLLKVAPWVLGTGLLCLRRPRWMLPAAVVALPVVLSEWPGTASWSTHYGYLPTLFLALAWLPWVDSHPRDWGRVVAGCVGLMLVAGPLVPSIAFALPGRSFAATYWGRPAEGDMRCVVRDVPASAGVAGTPAALALLAHRPSLYLWPYPFQPAGTGILPNPQLQRPRADLAAAVDVLIVSRGDPRPVPPDFVLERATTTVLRFARAGTGPGSSPPADRTGRRRPGPRGRFAVPGTSEHGLSSGRVRQACDSRGARAQPAQRLARAAP